MQRIHCLPFSLQATKSFEIVCEAYRNVLFVGLLRQQGLCPALLSESSPGNMFENLQTIRLGSPHILRTLHSSLLDYTLDDVFAIESHLFAIRPDIQGAIPLLVAGHRSMDVATRWSAQRIQRFLCLDVARLPIDSIANT